MTNKSNFIPKYHCMVVHAYYPLGETRVEREALALLAAGYQVDLICLRAKNEPAISNEEGVTVYRLPARRRLLGGIAGQLMEYLFFFVLAFFKLTWLHWRNHYSTVQLHNLPDFLVFAALIPKLTGAKVILDIHDVMPEFYAAKFKTDLTSLPVKLVIWQEQLSCWFADHVITVTEPWRETLIERGVPREKTSVVMNVADARIFHPLAANQIPPKDTTHFKLIYHGTLSPRYGLDLTIRALDLVRHKVPHIHLTIHGGGDLWQDELNDLMALADQLGVRNLIHFSTQFVSIEELPPIIRQADVGVVSYRRDVFTDGILPTKVMEYMALGMPVIAARTPVIDAYFDETMIELFTPENVEELASAIIRLAEDKTRLATLQKGTTIFTERYSWANVSGAYVALVDKLSGRDTPPYTTKPHVIYCGPQDQTRWNTFVENSPYGHLMQSWEWGDFKLAEGWLVERIGLEQDGSLIAGAQVLFKRAPGLPFTIGYIPKGPLVDLQNSYLTNQLLKAIHQQARQHKTIFLKIEPNMLDEVSLHHYLNQYGFKASPHTNQPRSSIVVNLKQGEDTIFRNMRKQTRKSIRSAIRKGVKIVEGGTDDLADYYHILKFTAYNKNFTIHHQPFYEQAWHTFNRIGKVKLLLAKYDDKLVAGKMIFVFGDRCMHLWGGTTKSGRQVDASYLIQWEAIKWAIRQGCAYTDLWGIPDEFGKLLKEGKEITDTSAPLAGVYLFKSGFSKESEYYVGAYDYVYALISYFILETLVNLVKLDIIFDWLNKIQRPPQWRRKFGSKEVLALLGVALILVYLLFNKKTDKP